MVAGTKTTVSNIETKVEDIHRNMLNGQKGASDQINSVYVTSYL